MHFGAGNRLDKCVNIVWRSAGNFIRRSSVGQGRVRVQKGARNGSKVNETPLITCGKEEKRANKGGNFSLPIETFIGVSGRVRQCARETVPVVGPANINSSKREGVWQLPFRDSTSSATEDRKRCLPIRT